MVIDVHLSFLQAIVYDIPLANYYWLSIVLTVFLCPVFVSIASYSSIILQLIKHSRKMAAHQTIKNSPHTRTRCVKKTFSRVIFVSRLSVTAKLKISLSLMMLAMLLCWGPMIVWHILRYFKGDFRQFYSEVMFQSNICFPLDNPV